METAEITRRLLTAWEKTLKLCDSTPVSTRCSLPVTRRSKSWVGVRLLLRGFRCAGRTARLAGLLSSSGS